MSNQARDDKMRRLWAEGWSGRAISEALSLTVWQVYALRQRLDLPPRKRGGRRGAYAARAARATRATELEVEPLSPLSVGQLTSFQRWWSQGESLSEIAEALGRTPEQVTVLADLMGWAFGGEVGQ